VSPVDGDGAADLDLPGPWAPPTLQKQAEPLQRVIVSAFDPSVPLAE
jgi:hypothetical protein